jgi:hypothetical protein
MTSGPVIEHAGLTVTVFVHVLLQPELFTIVRVKVNEPPAAPAITLTF